MNESTLVDSLRTLSRYEAGSKKFNGLKTKKPISNHFRVMKKLEKTETKYI